ncbi:MAG: T9SS type A sorting domain-containing protein [Bacteroidetes bacterium]|nr:T9SS type A sorting domain-containing protein [Bacteroidota bacterium]
MKEIYKTKMLRMLKGLGVAAAFTAATSLSLSAQEMRPAVNPSVDAFAGYTGPSNEGTPTPDALFDVQFDYNITSLANSVGCAGATFVQNKFWVSKWQSDTIMQFSKTGAFLSKFTIPGLTGVRSFTTAGAYIYAATNTTTIYRIDTALRVLAPPHITSGSANTVRHMSYDPTLNGNAGGFWVGNFGTDIDAISMSGAVLTSIPSGTHGLTGMYGSAYDGQTAGGPYLWIFNQGGANTTQIERITIATGTTTPLAARDAFLDFNTSNSLTSGLAGGLFIAQGIVPGQWTIGGVIQGTPNNVLFGYELNDLALANDDAAASGLRPTEGYTRIPTSQTFGETFSVQATNLGGTTIGMIHVDFSVKFNGGAVVFNNMQTSNNLGSGQSVTLTSSAFSPASGIGTYDVMAVAYPMVGTDPNHANDTAFFSFQVTDSTFARDDDQPDGGAGYAVSGTDWAYALTNFEVQRADSLSSIWIELANPVIGDTTYAVVASTLNGVPGAVLYTGPVQIIGSGTTMVLPVPGGLNLTPGTYSFGCYEGGPTTINLAQSNNLFTPGMNFFYTPANGWVQSGIQTARFIRPNFGNTVGVAVENGFESGVHVFPNPSRDKFFVAFRDQLNADVTISVVNPVGQVIREMVVNPSLQQQSMVELTGEANGIYFIRIQNGVQSTVRKVVLAQ